MVMVNFLTQQIKVLVEVFGKEVYWMDKVNMLNQEAQFIEWFGAKERYVVWNDIM